MGPWHPVKTLSSMFRPLLPVNGHHHHLSLPLHQFYPVCLIPFHPLTLSLVFTPLHAHVVSQCLLNLNWVVTPPLPLHLSFMTPSSLLSVMTFSLLHPTWILLISFTAHQLQLIVTVWNLSHLFLLHLVYFIPPLSQ